MILSTRSLTKVYGGTRALEQIELEVPERSVYGLVGPNGAGKTTLLSILAGLRQPTSGSVQIQVAQEEWAMCPDAPAFEPWLTAAEVLRLAGTLAGRPPSEERVELLLHEAGLKDAAERRVGGFSRGMTQRLAVAATIVAGPHLVILDEPCSALDPAGRVEVLDLVRSISVGATVVFSSHVLADVQRVCDTVGVLDHGKLIYQGALDGLLDQYTRPVWRLAIRDRPQEVANALEKMEWVLSVATIGDFTLRLEATSADVAEREIAGVVHAAGARLASFEPEVPNLESVFLALTATLPTPVEVA